MLLTIKCFFLLIFKETHMKSYLFLNGWWAIVKMNLYPLFILGLILQLKHEQLSRNPFNCFKKSLSFDTSAAAAAPKIKLFMSFALIPSLPCALCSAYLSEEKHWYHKFNGLMCIVHLIKPTSDFVRAGSIKANEITWNCQNTRPLC